MPAHRTRSSISLSLPSTSLDVKADAPQPPSVSIISPTPRAFTFPFNVHDPTTPRAQAFPADVQNTPRASTPRTPSPSISPFEPDLVSRGNTRTPLHGSVIPLPVVSSPLSQHRRRGSACSSTERKPKKGDEDYIKRPENAFILFRRDCCMQKNAAEAGQNETAGQRRQRQADLSKTISQQWRNLSSEERAYWDDLAKQRKKEHEEMYPWYVYQPTRSKEKLKVSGKSSSKARKGKGKASNHDCEEISADTDESESLSFAFHSGRRASSAPTPPPGYFPQIRLPTLLPPSCPTSPESPQKANGRQPTMPSPFQMIAQEALGHSSSLVQEPMNTSGQVPDYNTNVNSAMFTNSYESVQSGDRPPIRTFPAVSAHGPPRLNLNTTGLMPLSCSPSVTSSSSPATPQRGNPFGFGTPFSPSLQSPASAPTSRTLDTPKSSEWDSFGLPSWALPTLWPSFDPEVQGLTGDLDMTSIPPLALDLPHQSHHEKDIQDTFSDPLFGLQFRFEDLLDPSQL